MRRSIAIQFVRRSSLLAAILLPGIGICLASPTFAQTSTRLAEPKPLTEFPPKGKFHIYLLMGQDNMIGRGKVSDEDRKLASRVVKLDREGRWVPAVDPLHSENLAIDGVGPGLSFGRLVSADDDTITVGLVPCAKPGSPLTSWQPEGSAYRNAIKQAKLAQERGTLKGILWHHGEYDGRLRVQSATYGIRLAEIVLAFRKDVHEPQLPFIAARMADFVRPDRIPYANRINSALDRLPREVRYVSLVNTDHLTPIGGTDDFDARSARELGVRFAKTVRDLRFEQARK